MKATSVLILEDKPKEREYLHEFLAAEGFLVRSAADIPTARALLGEAGRELDVVILDVVIEGSKATGLDFGLEIKERYRERPPEFLIHTAYPKAEYYRVAWGLGAGTYLLKPSGLAEVLGAVRALALRRSLLPSKEMVGRIQQLARQSHDPAEAISLFCRNILRAELEAALGAPFVLLVGEDAATVNVGGGAGLPERSSAYGWLQRLAHLQPPSEPLLVTAGLAPAGPPSPERDAALELMHRLTGTALIPLASREGLKLSLGIVEREKPKLSALGTAVEFAKILGGLVQPTLVGLLMDLIEAAARTFAEQRSVLDAAADFCLYVGQEQLQLLDQVVRSGAFAADPLPVELQRLIALGENLRNAGEVLSWVKDSPRQEGVTTARQRPVPSMKALVNEVWEDVREELAPADRDLLQIAGEDCQIAARAESLEVAIARILRWLTARARETPSHVQPSVSVRLRATDQGAEIDFIDRSRRLPEPLRERLFSPFAAAAGQSEAQFYPELLDLYLSKVLVERERGYLEDRSANLEHDSGHHFVMRFPQRRSAAAGIA